MVNFNSFLNNFQIFKFIQNFQFIFLYILTFYIQYLIILFFSQVKMVVGSIQERIKKMKQAIQNQAKQRALYIVQKAEQQADIERVSIIKAQKQKIDHQFSNLSKQQKVKAKIEKSSVINKLRIKKMQIRHELVQELRTLLLQKLKQKINNKEEYSKHLHNFIVQGMLRMMQKNVAVETRVQHRQISKSIFSKCQKSFTSIILKQTGKQMQSKLCLSQFNLQQSHKNVIGGVFLRSNDGSIVTDNSLDARVKLIFEQLLPVIRGMLFPKNA